MFTWHFLITCKNQKADFHNYLSYERSFLDVDGSEDCIGRALWSLRMRSKLFFAQVSENGC